MTVLVENPTKLQVAYPPSTAHLTHTAEQTRVLVKCCAQNRLLRTGSSDFHGPHHRLLSSFRAFSLYGFSPELGAIAHPG